MHYRLYQPADFAELYAIEETCFQPPIRFPRRHVRHLVERAESATWIAEEDGVLAGFAIVTWDENPDGASPYIQTLEVAPGFRRRGIGRELLNRIEHSALKAVGRCQIWLHVDTENESAIRLYRSHGYQYRGRRENYYARDRAAEIYSRLLAPEG